MCWRRVRDYLKKEKIMSEDLKLVFDIGFNFGNFTRALLRKSPQCKIIGIDANHVFGHVEVDGDFQFLPRAVCNRPSNSTINLAVDIHNLGVSTISRKFATESRFIKGSPTLSTLEKDNHMATINYQSFQAVKTIRVDDLIAEFGNPDLIKLDIEGAELDALMSLSSKAGKICFEFNEEFVDDVIMSIEHLQELGYSQFGAIGYFAGTNTPNVLTHEEEGGDNHLREPDNYISYQKLKESLVEVLDPARRISWGMVWAK
jgi:FkbM family methyltransferase